MTCPNCGRQFPNARGLGVHRAGHRAPLSPPAPLPRGRDRYAIERGEAAPVAKVTDWFRATYNGPILDGFGQ